MPFYEVSCAICFVFRACLTSKLSLLNVRMHLIDACVEAVIPSLFWSVVKVKQLVNVNQIKFKTFK